MGVGKRLRINNHLLEKKNVRLSAVNLIDFLYHKSIVRLLSKQTMSCIGSIIELESVLIKKYIVIFSKFR